MREYDVDAIYGRDALVLYLGDVRDLEVMRALFKQKAAEEEHAFTNKRNQYLTPDKRTAPMHKTHGCLIAWLVFWVFSICLFIPDCNAQVEKQGLSFLMPSGIFEWSIVGGTVFFLVRAIVQRMRVNSAKQAVKEHNLKDEERLAVNRQYIEKERESLQVRKARLQRMVARTEKALKRNYDLNIIPRQYRNLTSALYLYDFMSTSRQPFSQALDHAQIDEGIRRIEAKLNIIISQNEAQLRQLAQINTNVETLKKQSNRILAAQVATAYYASAAAAHAESIDAKLENMQSYVSYGF